MFNFYLLLNTDRTNDPLNIKWQERVENKNKKIKKFPLNPLSILSFT